MTEALEKLMREYMALPKEKRDALAKLAQEQTRSLLWVPTPGAQAEAYHCLADELFMGGSAGGGKTDLGIGLALTAHKVCLHLRRYNKDARDMYKRAHSILETPPAQWEGEEFSVDGNKQFLEIIVGKERHLTFGGCQYEEDKERYKGHPHDLIHFDEVCDFTRSQFEFIKIWNRAASEGGKPQRCRILCTGNPPTTPEGRWVIDYWAPWLDPKHPNPAKSGEIRWFCQNAMGKDVEVAGPGLHRVDDDPHSKPVRAVSRCFIRAMLKDNPYLMRTDYEARLDAMPAHLRAAYRDGRFDAVLEDSVQQVIPTQWLFEAVERGRRQRVPPQGVPMCAMGVDIAQGGKDNTILSMRHDAWFAPLVCVPGTKTPTGREVAALILTNRRDNCCLTLDMGGGYGGATAEILRETNATVHLHKGAEGSTGRTRDGTFSFTNKRSEALWRFREALDPDQPGGSSVCLPDDSELVSDLAAPTYEVTRQGIKVEAKDRIKERLGRSPDKGDAVIMSWINGPKMLNFRDGKINLASGPRRPAVHLGHEAQRRRRY